MYLEPAVCVGGGVHTMANKTVPDSDLSAFAPTGNDVSYSSNHTNK